MTAAELVNAEAKSIDPPEVIEVSETEVSCDGGAGALGHPRVYLKIAERGWVECPYCDRRFVLGTGAERAAD